MYSHLSINATPYYVIFPNYYSLLTSEFAMAKRSNNGAIKQRAYNKDYLMLGFIPSETLPINQFVSCAVRC